MQELQDAELLAPDELPKRGDRCALNAFSVVVDKSFALSIRMKSVQATHLPMKAPTNNVALLQTTSERS